MDASREPLARLVVVTGPIASGKSTVAELLCDRLVSAGVTVACVDVDVVARMARAPGGLAHAHWGQAHRAHGALVGSWLDSAIDVVVAHGPVFTREESAALMAHVPEGTPLVRVLLLASLEAAGARVAGDPERELSKDLAFLRGTYERFEALRPAMKPCDLTFDTETDPAGVIVTGILSRLGLQDGG